MTERATMVIDPLHPIADSIVFDDLYRLPETVRRLLIGRRLVWLTEFAAGDVHRAGAIIASCWAAAEEIALGRGLGEVVIGEMVGEVADGGL